ncbi:hypothetical protein ACIRD9_07740 [Streptomyces violaceus]
MVNVHCYNDSDKLSFGEAGFTFSLTGGGTSVTNSFTWDPMADNSDMAPNPGLGTPVQLAAPFTDDKVFARIDATSRARATRFRSWIT